MIALNRYLKLSLLVRNPAQNKCGTGMLLFAQYVLTNILGLLQAACLKML